ncbi:hypothetical protein P3W45_000694 [Vairimorpha bombi]
MKKYFVIIGCFAYTLAVYYIFVVFSEQQSKADAISYGEFVSKQKEFKIKKKICTHKQEKGTKKYRLKIRHKKLKTCNSRNNFESKIGDNEKGEIINDKQGEINDNREVSNKERENTDLININESMTDNTDLININESMTENTDLININESMTENTDLININESMTENTDLKSDEKVRDSDYFSESEDNDKSFSELVDHDNLDYFYTLSFIKYKSSSNLFLQQFFVPTIMNTWSWVELDEKFGFIKNDVLGFIDRYENLFRNLQYDIHKEDIESIKRSVYKYYIEYLEGFLNIIYREYIFDSDDSDWCDDFYTLNHNQIVLNFRKILNFMKNRKKEDNYLCILLSETIDILDYETSLNKEVDLVLHLCGIFITDIIKLIEMKIFNNLFDVFLLYNSLVLRLAEDKLGLIRSFKYGYKEKTKLIDIRDYLKLPFEECDEDTKKNISLNNINLDIILSLYNVIGIINIRMEYPEIGSKAYRANQNLLHKYIRNIKNLSLVDSEYLSYALEIAEKLDEAFDDEIKACNKMIT